MGECVKVIVRCRPMNGREKGLNCKDVINIDSRTALCCIKNPEDKRGEPKSFTFDGAYDINSTTDQIYADIGFPLVEGVTEGYNGTIFAYGQTGCGKSFTMQGILDPATQRGIIPRAFDHIFETIQVSDGAKYLVHASYLEIYNEEIRDLLGKDVKQRLELKEHPDKGVYVQSLSMHPCKNVTDCERVMERGWKNRSTGATLMNADSSRSHSIFSIHLERCESSDDGKDHIRAAKLNLVDLAGSERQAKTGSTGDRLKEATKINLSLSALGNVISALVDGKSKHIPYRDSKLTRMLQDSLGGNTKTLMIACLSPADNNYDETLSTLRYANRAKNIKNKPKINEDPKDAMLREYQDEISRLKAMLRGEMPIQVEGTDGGGGRTRVIEKVVHVTNQAEIEAAKQSIRDECEAEMRRMMAELTAVKASKGEVEKEVNKLREHFENKMYELEQNSSPEKRKIGGVGKTGKNINDDEAVYQSSGQQAGGVRNGKAGGKQRSSRNNDDDEVDDVNRRTSNDPNDAKRRLLELQQIMVGGELSNNAEVKERRKKKQKYSEERRRKLQEALLSLDGDEIIAGIYENTQDELRSKSKLLERERKKTESMQREILDLQSEFEFDRIDYLDTIRKQSQEVSYLQSVIDTIHPALRRDCNYVNLDRIRSQSTWDELNQRWILPKLTTEKSHLPPANGAVNGRMDSSTSRQTDDSLDDLRSEDRYIQKLHDSEDQHMANNYFKTNRQNELRQKSKSTTNSQNSSGYDSLSSRSSRNMAVTEADDFQKKPVRLESLGQSSGRQARKKGRGFQNDQYDR